MPCLKLIFFYVICKMTFMIKICFYSDSIFFFFLFCFCFCLCFVDFFFDVHGSYFDKRCFCLHSLFVCYFFFYIYDYQTNDMFTHGICIRVSRTRGYDSSTRKKRKYKTQKYSKIFFSQTAYTMDSKHRPTSETDIHYVNVCTFGLHFGFICLDQGDLMHPQKNVMLFNAFTKEWKCIKKWKQSIDDITAISAMVETADGSVYMGSHLGGLFQLSPSKKAPIRLIHNDVNFARLMVRGNEIFALQFMNDCLSLMVWRSNQMISFGDKPFIHVPRSERRIEHVQWLRTKNGTFILFIEFRTLQSTYDQTYIFCSRDPTKEPFKFVHKMNIFSDVPVICSGNVLLFENYMMEFSVIEGIYFDEGPPFKIKNHFTSTIEVPYGPVNWFVLDMPEKLFLLTSGWIRKEWNTHRIDINRFPPLYFIKSVAQWIFGSTVYIFSHDDNLMHTVDVLTILRSV